MKFIESLTAHRNKQCAMLAANFYNFETLQAILRAVKQSGSEIILQTSPSTLEYLSVPVAVAMARSAAKNADVQAWLHLDHATDRKLIEQCVAAGYDSVMIDASEHDFDENVARTRAIVEMAHATGVAVEAELGYVPKLGQPDVTASGLTDPAQARRFVELTRIDMLAVAIGSAHGFYRQKPNLDIPRLSRIRAQVDVPLVLHGGSGIPPQQWQAAIAEGIAKINFATEIKDTFTRNVKLALTASEEIDLRKTFPPATDAVTRLVAEKIQVCQMKGVAA
jgi:tagatose 1,6-diphosphate aldolase GatY/KbaY